MICSNDGRKGNLQRKAGKKIDMMNQVLHVEFCKNLTDETASAVALQYSRSQFTRIVSSQPAPLTHPYPCAQHPCAMTEQAAAAMEKVPLSEASEDTDENPTSNPNQSSIKPNNVVPPPDYAEIGAMPTEGSPNLFDRFLFQVHKFFYRVCHMLGAFFLHVLSVAMLLAGIIAAVIVQVLAYYYTGVLNLWVLVACLLYAPTLGSVALIREEMLLHGTSRSGTGPRMSQFVTFAYLVMTVSALASVFQPLVLHGENRISVKSFWTAIGGTALFYYCMLISEVLFAASLNLKKAKMEDEEQRRREREDPRWMTNYNSFGDE